LSSTDPIELNLDAMNAIDAIDPMNATDAMNAIDAIDAIDAIPLDIHEFLPYNIAKGGREENVSKESSEILCLLKFIKIRGFINILITFLIIRLSIYPLYGNYEEC